MDLKGIITITLGIAILLSIGGSLYGRIKTEKGIGWQFIRFYAIAITLPLTGILAINDALSEAVVAILAGALGYAFGKPGTDN